MANANPPVVVAQEIGQVGRNFLREVGSMFWFIAHTFGERLRRFHHGRVRSVAAGFFRLPSRPGAAQCPLVGLVTFFLALPMALLPGYSSQLFGPERWVPVP